MFALRWRKYRFFVLLISFVLHKKRDQHTEKNNEIESGVDYPKFLQEVTIESDHNRSGKEIGNQHTVNCGHVNAKVPSGWLDSMMGEYFVEFLALCFWVFKFYFLFLILL